MTNEYGNLYERIADAIVRARSEGFNATAEALEAFVATLECFEVQPAIGVSKGDNFVCLEKPIPLSPKAAGVKGRS